MSGVSNQYDPDWLALVTRLQRAETNLRANQISAREAGNKFEERRLAGKREGVSLARSYVEEYLR